MIEIGKKEENGYNLYTIDYRVDLMVVDPADYSDYDNRMRSGKSEGYPFVVVLNTVSLTKTAVLANDPNLQKYLGDRWNMIVGRGITVEHFQGNRWFIAWRPYWPNPADLAFLMKGKNLEP